MKKFTSLKIAMLMSLAIGSLNLCAWQSDDSQQGQHHKGHKRNNRPKAVIMNEDEAMQLEEILDETKARLDKEVGKVPTEHSIKKFLHSVLEDFKQSDRLSMAVETAKAKLDDAKIAIRRFSAKLRAVDKHEIASTHIRSLWRKLKEVRCYVNDHMVKEVAVEMESSEDELNLDDNMESESNDNMESESNEVVIQKGNPPVTFKLN